MWTYEKFTHKYIINHSAFRKDNSELWPVLQISLWGFLGFVSLHIEHSEHHVTVYKKYM
jgi:hypothetical protein